ncbi:6-phosphogluconolactonase [Desulfovibrio mangrovi]|uniref:6-phosphogluconolactonase n=1 Tax=Desulfovibrio mangrovi TaxID=2976983 RepID=UPI00224534DC|nr:6-phosphogluconolactonase [Desulfovibrio mangrovi]UZP68705.1 6-phosphogluconolactonase [Desulfovibrio mangrovi]
MPTSTQLSLHVAENPETLARLAAKLVIERCQKAIAERGTFTIALSGGKTPTLLFQLLATPEFQKSLPWEKVLFYWVDERCVDPDHSDSNYRVARDELLQKVEATKFYRMRGELDPEEAAQAYERLLRQHFELGAGELPRFDCILLGMGADGHVASLFPEEEGINIKDRLVIDQRISKLKSDRLTLTLPVLNNARCCIFMVQGKEKHEVLAKALNILGSPDLPAQKVKPVNGELIWVVDEDARQG